MCIESLCQMCCWGNLRSVVRPVGVGKPSQAQTSAAHQTSDVVAESGFGAFICEIVKSVKCFSLRQSF